MYSFTKSMQSLFQNVTPWTLFIWFAVSFGVGILGYRLVDGADWTDAALNASTTISGMGLPNPPKTASGKIFATVYALYSGIFFIIVFGVLLVHLLQLH